MGALSRALRAMKCNADGLVGTCAAGEWVIQACPEHWVCLDGNCVDQSTVCTPETIRCDLTGRRERCDAQGRWVLDRCPQVKRVWTTAPALIVFVIPGNADAQTLVMVLNHSASL